jgi:FKBP-type peptidyl-prolyl cis-trans isomerase
MEKPGKFRLTVGGMLVVVALVAFAIAAFRPKTTKLVDIKVGSGPAVKAGDSVSVHYVGRLTDGKTFDSSVARNGPFDFNVGQGIVIKGWDIGLVGMQAGGVRRLIIPPEQAYGSRGVPGIPPNSTLVFDIELLKIR